MKDINLYLIEKLKISETSFMLEKLKIGTDTKISKHKYHPKNLNELKNIIKNLVKERGWNANLNDIDTSKITSMFFLFTYDLKEFDGNISDWNVSNVESFEAMFYNSKFSGNNSDISHWDVSNANCLACMFERSAFDKKNQIENWDVKANDTEGMFHASPLEKNPPRWFHE